MIVENFRYPFIPGVKGIPPQEFILPEGLETHDFLAGSGRVIRRFAEPDRIVFRESEKHHQFDKLFNMEAGLNRWGQLNFDLYIRQVDDKGEKHRHPDFFGPDFLHEMIGHVFKGEIHSIKSLWYKPFGSYNYDLYQEALKKGLNEQDAANSTWTGQIVGAHGFKASSDISDSNGRIEVIFLPD